MNIVYIAPMFHTNQVPITKGWREQGHNVDFICQHKGNTENHQYCTPYVMGYSLIFNFILQIHQFVKKKSLQKAFYPEAFRDRFGFPPVFRFIKMINAINPDIVILRERSVYSIVSYILCKMMKFRCILYNQTPLWDYEPPRNDIPHKIVKMLTPSLRITPVLGNPSTGYFDEKAIYIPFVIDPHMSSEKKVYFQNDRINILCVGKYEERKNQLMLLEICSKLISKYNLHITLVGEMSTPYHQQHYEKIQKFIEEHDMCDMVECYTNQKPDSMSVFYEKADMFVLPSTGEFASVSQLEAMSYSLPVIVSDTNGTSCYVESGQNGYVFRDNDVDDMMDKLSKILADRDIIVEMGRHSYQLVNQKYSFLNYKTAIEKIINTSFS